VRLETELSFNRGDADFQLKALVNFGFLELGQLGVEAIDFAREVGLDGGYSGVCGMTR
jgi:hypothetical protein